MGIDVKLTCMMSLDDLGADLIVSRGRASKVSGATHMFNPTVVIYLDTAKTIAPLSTFYRVCNISFDSNFHKQSRRKSHAMEHRTFALARATLGAGARRQYATVIEPPATSKTARGEKVISFDHFLQRQRVLGLWREIVRATNKISNDKTKNEMRSFARDEFERYRKVEDLEHIRYLVSTGKDQFKSISRYVEQMRTF